MWGETPHAPLAFFPPTRHCALRCTSVAKRAVWHALCQRSDALFASNASDVGGDPPHPPCFCPPTHPFCCGLLLRCAEGRFAFIGSTTHSFSESLGVLYAKDATPSWAAPVRPFRCGPCGGVPRDAPSLREAKPLRFPFHCKRRVRSLRLSLRGHTPTDFATPTPPTIRRRRRVRSCERGGRRRFAPPGCSPSRPPMRATPQPATPAQTKRSAAKARPRLWQGH